MRVPVGDAMIDVSVTEFARAMAERVPAYRDFLRSAGWQAKDITSAEAVATLPWVDKANYLTQYDTADLSWDGDPFRSDLISVSSGSSGEPFFWPRGRAQAREGVDLHERIFTESFASHERTTLVVVCFSMGTWIAGTFTTESALGLAQRGHKMHIATPGIEKDEALRVIQRLGGNYDQIVIAGYPPFVKDILDLGITRGLDWSALRVRLLLAGETFSEEWRDHVVGLLGPGADPLTDVINIYGSADAAILGHETATSIAVRRGLWNQPTAAADIFGEGPMPSLVSVDMRIRHFETCDGELLLTVSSGLPLTRYNFHDRGAVHTVGGLLPFASSDGAVAQPEDNERLVSVHGRSDHTATIYAVNVYPETIKIALLHPRLVGLVTGKFVMATKNERDHSQYLELVIERAPEQIPGPHEEPLIREVVHQELRRLNAEYAKLHTAIGDDAVPRIVLAATNDTVHFGDGVKQRWTAKASA
jgi:phenylacetate-CoA ligase